MKSKLSSAVAMAGVAGLLVASTAIAQTTSINSGSLGAAGNGTNTAGVLLGQPSPIVAGASNAVSYSGGERTTVPFNAALNPAAGSPFTIELWVRPTAGDNDDTPLSNRFASGDRSGWTFFQRPESQGWNFRMYNGVGNALGWDLTGGTSTLNTWNHVVATWNGTAALLYVNGVLADNTNDPAATGVYNPNTATNSPEFSIGANFDGGSPSTNSTDEVAFYGSALTAGQIANHFNLASSATPNAYSSAVLADGAIEYLSNVPEPTSLGFVLASGAVLMAGRRRRETAQRL